MLWSRHTSSWSYREKGVLDLGSSKLLTIPLLTTRVSNRTFESIEATKEIQATSSVDSVFQHQELYMALGTLPAKERSAIVMYYMNGYSIKEIADITDISEDAIKKQLSRGRDKLKEKLKL